MEEKIFHSKSGKVLKYLYSAPLTEKILPLIIYIHGAGSRGDNLESLKSNAGICHILEKAESKAIIVAPQCYADTWFELYEALLEFIEKMRNQENIDKNRIYITGASMGGYTTWQLCMSRPEWFAAAVPICGGGMYWNAVRLKDLPIWAFHGALDKVVYPEESVKMVEAVNRNGGSAKLTIFPEDSHNSWDSTYQTEEMWEWLFNQKRG